MQLKKLDEIAEIIMGQSPSSAFYNDEGDGLPFFQGKSDFGETYPSPRIFCSKPLKVAIENDVLMSVRAPIGDVNIASEECCIGRGIAAIRCKEDVNYKYLFYILDFMKEKIARLGTGSTFKAINKMMLSSIEIPVPSIEKQIKIVNVLDKLKEAIRNRQAQITALVELTQSVFMEMFSEMSEKVRLGDIAEVQTGSTPSRKNELYWKNGTIPWIKTAEVNMNHIDNSEEYITEKALEESSLSLLPINTVLVAMYGQGATRGRVGLLKIEATTNQACAAILPNEKINSDFLFKQLAINYKKLRDLGRGGNQPNLNLSLVKNFEILLPPLSKQNEFSRVNEIIELKKQQLMLSLDYLETLYDSLLQKSFNGELFQDQA